MIKQGGFILAVCLGLFPGTALFSVEVHEKLEAPHLEDQARRLGQTLKCPTCRGQSVEDSRAEMAATLRALIRTRLQAGETPDDIRKHLKELYGEEVLFDPIWSPKTYLLWLGPFLFLALALGFGIMRGMRRKSEAKSHIEA